jgi:hypothetical protein
MELVVYVHVLRYENFAYLLLTGCMARKLTKMEREGNLKKRVILL